MTSRLDTKAAKLAFRQRYYIPKIEANCQIAGALPLLKHFLKHHCGAQSLEELNSEQLRLVYSTSEEWRRLSETDTKSAGDNVVSINQARK